MSRLADLVSAARHPVRVVLGLMSGMSRDGLDMALVRIDGEGTVLDINLLAFETWPYPTALRQRLLEAEGATTEELCRLDRDLAEAWAEQIVPFAASAPRNVPRPHWIGSHGQTVFHRPRDGDVPALTLQIGDADVLAERTGMSVVSDFRRRDIAAGGEGAPLIPMADWVLYADGTSTSACQNLGSIANVTVLPPDVEDLLAFDTGPANALIDAFARRAEEGDGIDRDGRISASGRVDDDLLLWLYTKRARWLSAPPPKSAGFATFGEDLAIAAREAHPGTSVRDCVRTAVEFTATTLADAYERHVLTRFPDLRQVRFSGGGCLNPTLMARIEACLARLGLAVERLSPRWVAGKEAAGFALLADLTLRGLAGNHPGATGASHPVVLGKISP